MVECRTISRAFTYSKTSTRRDINILSLTPSNERPDKRLRLVGGGVNFRIWNILTVATIVLTIGIWDFSVTKTRLRMHSKFSKRGTPYQCPGNRFSKFSIVATTALKIGRWGFLVTRNCLRILQKVSELGNKVSTPLRKILELFNRCFDYSEDR